MVIGIEGYVGAGKTSICRELLKIIPNSVMLNGGNWYRAVVYAMLNSGKSMEELAQITQNNDITEFMKDFGIELKIENNETIPYINGERCDEEQLQNKQSSLAVSKIGRVANNEKLFKVAHDLIEDLSKSHNVIISGRSIMLMYPEVDYHLFITASLDERVRRKFIQYNGEESEESIRENLTERDKYHEEAGFHKLYDKTIVIDVTNCKSAHESTELVLKTIHYGDYK